MKKMVAGLVLAVIVGLAIGAGVAKASNCDDDSVEAVSSDGTILKTLSGSVYEIGADAVDVALWLSADDLLVCPTSSRGIYKIINTDENNEIAYGRRLR